MIKGLAPCRCPRGTTNDIPGEVIAVTPDDASQHAVGLPNHKPASYDSESIQGLLMVALTPDNVPRFNFIAFHNPYRLTIARPWMMAGMVRQNLFSATYDNLLHDLPLSFNSYIRNPGGFSLTWQHPYSMFGIVFPDNGLEKLTWLEPPCELLFSPQRLLYQDLRFF